MKLGGVFGISLAPHASQWVNCGNVCEIITQLVAQRPRICVIVVAAVRCWMMGCRSSATAMLDALEWVDA